MQCIQVHEQVREGLDAHRAVLALESTVYSLLGIPAPFNEEALRRCLAVLAAHDVIPAVTAVIDGTAKIGLTEDEYARVLTARRKVSIRDLPLALSQSWPVGVTTVSASLSLAAKAGIHIFATGGIGGVHRENPRDVSADLPALARYPILTVCSGAKSFLHIEATLEYLETLGVAVIGWGTKEFPAFFTASSGISLPYSLHSADAAATVLRNMHALGEQRGILLGVPPPYSLDADEIRDIIHKVLASPMEELGAAVTPYILQKIAEKSEGESVKANVALVEHNCTIAAQIAKAYARAQETHSG